MSFLCLGEALIDVVVGPDGVVQGEHVGGSVFNVACGLARLDQDTTLASWWGQDPHGTAIETAAKTAGLNILTGSNGAKATSTARAQLDTQGHAEYRFDLEWDLPDLPDADNYSHWHIGSFSALLGEGGRKIAELTARRPENVTLSYDPNIRPALVEDRDVTRDQVEALIKHCDLVKASDEDVEFLYPNVPLEQVAHAWLKPDSDGEGGPEVVVFTRGGAGADLYTSWLSDPIHVDPAGVQVVDTVGAGDSFMAGLLAACQENQALGRGRAAWRNLDVVQLTQILNFANATAAVTVTHQGAYSPTKSEISL